MAEEFENFDEMARRAAALVEKWERGAAAEPAHAPDPVSAYLESLPDLAARHTAATGLRAIGGIIAGCGDCVPAVAWGRLRAPQTQALAGAVRERYPEEVAARYLAALDGVLRQAGRLGLMTPGQLAAALEPLASAPMN